MTTLHPLHQWFTPAAFHVISKLSFMEMKHRKQVPTRDVAEVLADLNDSDVHAFPRASVAAEVVQLVDPGFDYEQFTRLFVATRYHTPGQPIDDTHDGADTAMRLYLADVDPKALEHHPSTGDPALLLGVLRWLHDGLGGPTISLLLLSGQFTPAEIDHLVETDAVPDDDALKVLTALR